MLANYHILITEQMLCASDGGNLKERDACQVNGISGGWNVTTTPSYNIVVSRKLRLTHLNGIHHTEV